MRALSILPALGCTAILGACADAERTPDSAILELDLAAVRDLGWVAADASDAVASHAALSRARSLASAAGAGTNALALNVADAGTARVELSSALAAERRRALESALLDLGRVEFRIVASDEELEALGTSGALEQATLEAWHSDHPGARLGEFNGVAPASDGPSQGVRWCERAPWEDETNSAIDRAMLLIEPTNLDECFGGSDFAKVFLSSDMLGYPAIGFAFRDELKDAFRAFTGKNVDRRMAILVGDVVISAPNIEDPLPGAGIIRGQFTNEEAENLQMRLESGTVPGPFHRVARR
jgi:preprotein translocase subunit SecD